MPLKRASACSLTLLVSTIQRHPQDHSGQDGPRPAPAGLRARHRHVQSTGLPHKVGRKRKWDLWFKTVY